MKRDRTTNPELANLRQVLRKKSRENQAKIWGDLARRLCASRRRRTSVNVSCINRYAKQRETVVVPGKVLGAGKIDHSVRVAAFAFSDQARFKILKAKGKCLSIPDLVKKNPKGTGVKIIG